MWKVTWALLFPIVLGAAGSEDLPLKSLDGISRPLEGHRGRIVVLDFWATWCAPCVEALPDLAALQKRFRDRGVDVIAVSVDEPESWDEAAAMLEREAPGVTLRVGPSMAEVSQLTGTDSIPATVVIDDDGSIATHIAGSFDPDELSDLLDWLTGDRDEPRPGHEHAGEHDHDHEEAEAKPRKGESLVPS